MIEKDITIRREELEKLSTWELERILRTELDSDAPERENILLLLSILEGRDPTDPANRPEGAAEAWNEFVNRTVVSEQSVDKPIRKTKKWFVPVAAAAAVALILLMTVPQTVGAESIFEILGRWTREVFYLFDKEEASSNDEYIFRTDHEGLQQVYDAVVEQGVTDPIVPTWIPEGYVLKDFQVLSPGENTKIYAQFVRDDCYIQFVVGLPGSPKYNGYPKNEDETVVYDSAGVNYYVVSNEETWKAVWCNERAECSVVTNDTKEVLYKLLKSIQERGKQ